MVRRKALFVDQPVVLALFSGDRKQVGGFVREILPADDMVCEQDFLDYDTQRVQADEPSVGTDYRR